MIWSNLKIPKYQGRNVCFVPGGRSFFGNPLQGVYQYVLSCTAFYAATSSGHEETPVAHMSVTLTIHMPTWNAEHCRNAHATGMLV